MDFVVREKNFTRGIILGALSAACYGVNPTALYLYQSGFSPMVVLMYRYLFAALFITLLLLVRREQFKCTKSEFWRLILMGIIFSLSSLTLFVSYQYIPVSIASTLLFCYPAFVAIVMAIAYKEKISKLQSVGMIMVCLGIILLNIKPEEGDAIDFTKMLFGICLVILSSLLYAIYIVATQQDKILSRVSSARLSFYSIVVGSILYSIAVLTNIFNYSTICLSSDRDWLCAISLGLFPTLISITLLAKSIHDVGPTIAAILGAFEPITAVAIGMILFQERPSWLSFLSMAIIIIGISIVIVRGKTKQKESQIITNS
ncbi:MAG: EamA family transporter [Marinilabiliaceae bacterium]|nr:EamA family transporter [Marinilabiliaceae bacterium]